MRLRFHCEAEYALPVSTSSECPCAMCREFRRQQQQKPKKDKTETRGLIVLESEPQFRTIFTNSNKGMKRLAFPYILHVVSYTKVGNKYIYPGIYESGLRIFFRGSKMNKYSDSVSPAATDYARFGVCCTPHEHDKKSFDNYHDMCNFVVSTWWNMRHVIENAAQQWPDFTLEKSLQFNWGRKNSFPDALMKTEESGYGQSKSFYPPTDSLLIDEPWITKPAVLKEL